MRWVGLATLFLLTLPPPGLGAAELALPAAPPADGGVRVYRGPGSGPLPAPVAPAAGDRRLVGGKTLWTVDEAAGTAVGCRLEGTMMVGQRRIRCARGRMPQP